MGTALIKSYKHVEKIKYLELNKGGELHDRKAIFLDLNKDLYLVLVMKGTIVRL